MNTRDFFLMNKKLFHDHEQEFLRTFKIALKSYWDIYTGFDVVAFDEYIKPRKNESTKDAIGRKYGKDAVVLVEKLIG